jgi:hypothetical protein
MRLLPASRGSICPASTSSLWSRTTGATRPASTTSVPSRRRWSKPGPNRPPQCWIYRYPLKSLRSSSQALKRFANADRKRSRAVVDRGRLHGPSAHGPPPQEHQGQERERPRGFVDYRGGGMQIRCRGSCMPFPCFPPRARPVTSVRIRNNSSGGSARPGKGTGPAGRRVASDR